MTNRIATYILALIMSCLYSTAILAKGFVYDNLRYTIVSETDLTVSVTGLVSQSTQGGVFQMGVDFFGQLEETNTYSRIVIPEIVSYQSASYKVVGIYNGAFKNQTEIQSVSIPSSVVSIGTDAFYGTQLSSVVLPANLQTIESGAFGYCSNLRDIRCYAKKVPDMGLNASGNGPFYGTSISNCSLYVPFASLDDYKADEQWSKFGSITPIPPFASGKCGDNITWTIDSEWRLSISGKGEMYNYTSHNDVPWEEYCSQIASLQISEGVTSIGDMAFLECCKITSITIPHGVTNIGEYAFTECSGLTSIEIPQGVTHIESGAFSGCSGLTSIVIPQGVTNIEDYAFSGCSGLTSIEIPQGITSIGRYAFSSCRGLTSIEIPQGVTHIWDNAFSYCSGLTSIEIPQGGIIRIGEDAFQGCSGLKSITIPNSVISIGGGAFYGCSSLNEVYCYAENVPEMGVNETTGYDVFDDTKASNCILYVPSSSIEDYKADKQWGEFGMINALDTTHFIAFGKCGDNITWTIDDNYELAISGKGEMYNYDKLPCPWEEYSSQITSLQISEGISSIGNNAFYRCSSLSSVTIPEGVTSIGNKAFHGCRGLTSIVIPQGVTNIPTYAFYGCSGLTSIVIPQSVISIGNNAFASCSGLTTLNLSQGLTKIGECAFAGCDGLMSITIPNSVTSIGCLAFDNCPSLKEVLCYAENLPEMGVNESKGYDVFYGTKVSNCILYVPSSSLEAYKADKQWGKFGMIRAFGTANIIAFGKCGDNITWTIDDDYELAISGKGEMYNYSSYEDVPWIKYRSKITSLQISEGITNIGDWAFLGCSEIYSITIPHGVTNIGKAAFCKCYNLQSIIIPQGVINIDSEAFYGCNKLKSIVIPQGVTNIANYAFLDCSGLTSIVIPQGVTNIGDYAFVGCSGLTSIIIPQGVTNIGEAAFRECTELKSIIIPNSVTSIGTYAFANCSSLNEVYYYSTKTPKMGIDSKGYGVFYETKVSNSTLYVPAASLDEYKADAQWQEFGTIKAIDNTITLADNESSYNNNITKEGSTLSYTRTFNNTNLQALYVPFSMSYSDWSEDFDVYSINGFFEYDTDDDGIKDKAVLELMKVKAANGNLKPNHPYVIKAKEAGEKTITLTDATLYAKEINSIDCSTVETKYTFTGTYSRINGMKTNGYYALAGGELCPAQNDDVTLGAFRWYMSIQDRDSQFMHLVNNIKIRIYGEDDDATKIEGVEYVGSANNAIYTIDGRLVRSNTLRPGLYIKNGKKFLISK